jgi:hypothetical protein
LEYLLTYWQLLASVKYDSISQQLQQQAGTDNNIAVMVKAVVNMTYSDSFRRLLYHSRANNTCVDISYFKISYIISSLS